MTKTTCLRLTHGALALMLMIFLANASPSNKESSSVKWPQGQWSVRLSPYTGFGYETLPVRVYSVTSELEGLTVTKVGVENRTSQSLVAVKLTWYLSALQNPEDILQKGQTRLLELPGEIWANESREVIFPVASFAKIYKPLVKGGVLKGDFRIQVAVSEARFKDSSKWTLASLKNKSVGAQTVKAAYTINPSQQGFCPNQECVTVSGGDPNGPPAGYKCAGATGQSCTNSADGRTCTNSICGTGGGPRPPVTPPPRPQ